MSDPLHTFAVAWQTIVNDVSTFVVSHVHATDATTAAKTVQDAQPTAQVNSVVEVKAAPEPVAVVPTVVDAHLTDMQNALREFYLNSTIENSVKLKEAAKLYLGH